MPFTKRHHLVVEAGTGVGKSFAYLVPAILAAAEKAKEPKDKGDKDAPPPRVVVSTHTISLQEQLIRRTCRCCTASCRWSSRPCWSRAGATTSACGG